MIEIIVNQRDFDKALQIAISDGSTGYRIAGPKYDGNGKTLLRRKLTRRDADEIRAYLHKIVGRTSI